jgi:AraC-like DNA-binding protein
MNTKFIKSITAGGVTFRYSVGRSLARGKELHPHHEILYYLGGNAEFLSTEYHLHPQIGTLFVIPKEFFHNFRIGDEENYTRLTLAFGDGALPRWADKLFSDIRMISPSDELRALLDCMCERLNQKTDAVTTHGFMHGAFLMLISLLSDGSAGEACRVNEGELVECVRFIDKHFVEKLPLSLLCAQSHLSESALFRLFKKELGISPHRYITERRLIEANKLISEGYPATAAASSSGFSDYSAFYKAYFKKFGVPPSHTV